MQELSGKVAVITGGASGLGRSFADRFAAIRQQEAPDGGRGLRLFVEATVIGDLAEGSEFGHLGDYEHQLTVRETRDMAYLGRDLDTPPACR